jgi:parallel beta-helix repeat protein
MSALSIQPTFPIFTDIDGQPLEAGYVWIGQANLDPQVNPINVYWDAALTISATQPIRTLAGYPSRNGTPARLYVNSDYSIRVQNSKGSLVYSAPAATERYNDDVISEISAQNVTYDPPFVDSVPTNVEAKLSQYISVKDFGAVGDGVADDTVAIQSAIDGSPDGAEICFQAGAVYKVTKNTGFLPAVYTANDQPCLSIYQRTGLRLNGQGATLRVGVHAQGILDILDSEWITVENFNIEGSGNFPPLDGTTGRSEKGTVTEGYYNASSVANGPPRNNSQNTTTFSTGGYGGAFPQYSGGTAATWGAWEGGGFITNYGNGIFVDDGSTDITIQNNEIYGFNGNGIQINSQLTETYGWVAPDRVRVMDNYIHSNYNSGVEYHSVNDLLITGNFINDNGHPDASVTDASIDPGYGVASNNGTPPVRVTITENHFLSNKRKGVDAHSAVSMNVSNNIVFNSSEGIMLVNGSDGVIRNTVVADNMVSYIQYPPTAQGVGIYVERNSSGAAGFAGNTVVSGNIVSEVGVPPGEVANYPGTYPPGIGIQISGTQEGAVVSNNIVQNIDYFGFIGIAMGFGGTDTVKGIASGNYVKGKWGYGVFNSALNNQQNLVSSNNIFLDAISASYAGAQTGINNTSNRFAMANNVTVPNGQTYVAGSAANFSLIVNVTIAAGVITYTTGVGQDKYVVGVASNANGFQINLALGVAVQSVTVSQNSSSRAVVTAGSVPIDYVYIRSQSNPCEIGLQTSGTDRAASAVTGSFTIAIFA